MSDNWIAYRIRMKYKDLDAAAMTRGEHLRSSVKDDPTRMWPDGDPQDANGGTIDYDVDNFVNAHVPVERRQRVAAALRAVNRGPVSGGRGGGGK